MNRIQRARETVSGIVLVVVLASSVLAFTGWARASEAQDATEPEISPEQEESDLTVTGKRPKTWWQQQQEVRKARAEAYRERLRSRQKEAPQNNSVPARVSLPAAPVTDLSVSFKLDRRLTSGLYMGERWVSPRTYSGVSEGAFTVEVRVHGRDAKGQLVDIKPEWVPADSAIVTVSPARGKEVTITVQGAGESSVRVTVPRETEELSLSTELVIKARYQGTALQVEITPSRVTEVARQEQPGPAVENGWKFVDGDRSAQEQSRPIVRNGWRFVD